MSEVSQIERKEENGGAPGVAFIVVIHIVDLVANDDPAHELFHELDIHVTLAFAVLPKQ